MGTRVTIGAYSYEAASFTVSESSSPLAGGDTSGGVGDISVDIPAPFEDLTHPLLRFGSAWLIDQPITIKDSRYGTTTGSVIGAGVSNGIISVSATSRLAKLNIYNVNAKPFIGTLGGAFQYYLSLAGITSEFYVDPLVSTVPLTLRGFSGELWFYLKQLAASRDCDISLVSGIIVLRPIRTRTAETGRFIAVDPTTGIGSLAQTIEIYWYQSTAITDQLVYPPGGWVPEVEVLTVNAGETTEYQLELSASVTTIQAPVASTSVASGYTASSVYTIVADDGLPVPVAQWAANGGSLVVKVNPDTTSLTVTLVGATGIPVLGGNIAKSFSVALVSGASGNRYSTLRIVGTGVSYLRTKQVLRTGVSSTQTSNLIGETIDNVFITNLQDLYRIGLRSAARYAGLVPVVSGSVTAINKRGDSGSVDYPTYGEVKSALDPILGVGFSYSASQTRYLTVNLLPNYGAVQDYWFDTVRSDFANQAFGNVNGARIKDPVSKRWYRIRQGSITPASVQFDGEDDLLYGDFGAQYAGVTYSTLQTARAGLTYQQDRMVGLIG